MKVAFWHLILWMTLAFADGASEESCRNGCFHENGKDDRTCHCNYLCRSFNNCCKDFVETCLNVTTRRESCENRCYEPLGSKLVGYCDCDDGCSSRDTCCVNYAQVCTSPILCDHRCGAPREEELQCQCDGDCTKREDCCIDYPEKCPKSDTEEIAPTKKVDGPVFTVTLATTEAPTNATSGSRAAVMENWFLILCSFALPLRAIF